MRTREQTLNHLLYKRFQKALTDYSMLSDGDRILIALSGGKDSLCLLEMLARRQRIIKPRIEVEAVHVRMRNIHYESDTTYLESFASLHSVPLHIITTEFDNTKKTNKPACFLCSWHRRKALFRFAQDNGFNKIALGHHMDDIIRMAERQNIYIGMVCIWGGLVKGGAMDVEGAKAYGRFLAQRYKDFPNIIWIIGGDIQGNILS